MKRIARTVDVVIAGNSFVADWFSDYCATVEIVPTAIDTERFSFTPDARANQPFLVGWTGGADNLEHLYRIEGGLRRFLEQAPESKLRVICNREPRFRRIDAGRVEFVRWSEETEVAALQAISVGIMPLADTEWTRGKCSFKMLQYMSIGVPSVVSPVGMNTQILGMAKLGLGAKSDDEWFDALWSLHRDRDASVRMGAEGRRIAEERFSLDVVGRRLVEIFRARLA